MKAVINTPTQWVCSGTSDYIECYTLPDKQFNAVQLEAVGVNFKTATVTAYGLTGAAQIVDVPTGTTEICLVGGDGKFALSKVKVSNVPAGTYTFLFTCI